MRQSTVHIVGIFTFLCAATGLCASVSAQEPFIGEYDGVCHLLGYPDLPATATVVTEGPGLYRGLVHFTGPAPDSVQADIEIHGQLDSVRVTFSCVFRSVWWAGELSNDTLTLRRDDGYGMDFVLKRVTRKSPTEGLAAPEGAAVLIPFKSGVAPDMSAWTNPKWEPQPDGCVQIASGSGSNVTKDSFGSCRIHLEFNLPHMPTAQGQGRANSGLYIQNRYEIQILDSFGTLDGAGDCGAFYQIAAPRVNANLPPGCWQTYDLTFHAPKYNPDGSVKTNARITAELNGVVIHENLELPMETPGGMPLANGQDRGPMHLQDHGNPIRFRNMWIVPINE